MLPKVSLNELKEGTEKLIERRKSEMTKQENNDLKKY